MNSVRFLISSLFCVVVILFFGMAYPHHLHYQEQFQLFLFDSNYVWEIVKQPGGVADLLGRFCTQFFLYAWVGAFIIGILLSAIQLLTLRLFNASCTMFNGLSFIPSFLLWLFLLDEHALLGGVWAVLLTLLAVWGFIKLPKGWIRYTVMIVVLPILYWMVGPNWTGSHYYRYPTVVPTLLYAAWLSALVLPLIVSVCHKWFDLTHPSSLASHLSTLLVVIIMGTFVWKNCNFKAEKVMQYDFMACHQQWNRILETANAEKPNNQIGVTVQNLALAMHGLLTDHMFEYHQNGILGLLPDVQSDATSPMPTAEAFYQLGMIYVAQRTVFEAQEAILDFQKSARCYKRLAQTNLIIGSYEVARKYLLALQKTLFYRSCANETLQLLGDEKAIAQHPEYGRLRKSLYHQDFYFSDHVTADMLEDLYFSNKDNRLALEYLKAYCMLTNDRDRYARVLLKIEQ